MSGGSKTVTVGYWYGAGLHMALCHGPVDAVTRIVVGDKTAWSGSQTASGRLTINQSALFGGEDREGGVVGDVDVAFGEPAQSTNDYLQSKLGGTLPAFRGVLALIVRGARLAANNPYVKPWSVEARRIPAQTWYGAKAEIGGDANPAHIVYECLTNTLWGMGYGAGDLDDAAFRAAADTLHAENFGLSLLWDQQAEIEAFLGEVLEAIEATLYVHPRTGLFVLKLIRGGYTPSSLPLLDPSNVLALESFQRPAATGLINQVDLTYHDRATDREIAVTVQDIGALEALAGQVNAVSLRLRGIANGTLAAQVAMRELTQRARALAQVRLRANRTASAFVVGDVFRWSWPELGITDLVLRVTQIAYGTLTDGAVTIEAAEDVFAGNVTAYVTPPATAWTDPRTAPAASPTRYLYELPWYGVVRWITGESATLQAEVAPSDAFLAVAGTRPSADTIDIEALWGAGATPSSYATLGTTAPCPWGQMSAQAQLENQSTWVLAAYDDLEQVAAGTYAAIEGELVGVVSINVTTRTVVVDRGVLDTVPATHAAGAKLLFVEAGQAIDFDRHATSETVGVKLLPATAKGRLAEAAAPVDNLAFTGRANKPYAPGGTTINGQYWPTTAAGDLAIAWAHRDRTLQTGSLVAQTAGHIGPEAGVTYTLRIYNAQTGGSLIRTYSGLTGATQAYTRATAATDNGGTPPANLRVELESVRGGVPSHQKQVRSFAWTA